MRLATLCALLAGLACGEDGAPSRASDGDGGRRPASNERDGGRKPLRDGAIAFGGVRFHGAAVPATAPRDAAAPDAAPPDRKDALRARGEYLVRHVSGCNECHTPRLRSGRFDESKLLSGVEGFADVEPDDASRGLIHTRNLTPHDETGLGEWSDEQIKRAFQHGLNDESQVLHWLMPYWIFANMRDEDADAIVAYLRALPAVEHDVPLNQPNAVDMRRPYAAYALAREALPQSTLGAEHPEFESAQRGRYLAGGAAPGLLCHTPAAADPALPIDPARAFSGRRKLAGVKLGTPFDGAPLIESFNLTPHENGIGRWSAQDMANLLRVGVAPNGLPVCDPMPSYFGGSFTGLREQDALDLGHYFTTIPAQDSGVIPQCCTACHGDPMDRDAGGRE